MEIFAVSNFHGLCSYFCGFDFLPFTTDVKIKNFILGLFEWLKKKELQRNVSSVKLFEHFYYNGILKSDMYEQS